MKLHQIDFEETKRFSSIFLDYINNKKELQSHYTYRPEIASFKDAISNRNFDNTKRPVLVQALQEQYKSIRSHELVKDNIESLAEENTFTVTTGHQLNIFTGPLFFIYKIVATINMAKMLKKEYPSYHFVPIYWMASEDHDFEEINNFRLFGKKYSWETNQKGPVGKFDPKSMKNLLDEISEKPDFITSGYLDQNNLAEATRYIVHHLFGDQGLVILDANDHQLKKEFKHIIKDDLFNHSAHKQADKCTDKLEKLGYKSQLFPRPINLFYMEDTLRERIEEQAGKYHVLNTSIVLSKEEITDLVDNAPEKFSPNVVLRPVYQEVILPNLAYIGGPAEVAYWLQLKDGFDHFQIPFPVLFPRSFAMIIPKSIKKKMDKLALEANSMFEDFDVLKAQILYKDTEPLHDLSGQINEIENTFKSIQAKAQELDKSLEGFVQSEYKKIEKGVENIQKRLKRAEEQKEEVNIKQLESILDKLFPDGNPQEREDNFLNFYINNPSFIHELTSLFDPFQLKYNILTEHA